MDKKISELPEIQSLPDTAIFPCVTDEDNYKINVSSLKQIFSTYGSVQSDWSQNDSTQSDYIKNRPFYDTDGGTAEYEYSLDETTQPTCLYAGTTNVVGRLVSSEIPWETPENFNVDCIQSITYKGVEYDKSNCTVGETTSWVDNNIAQYINFTTSNGSQAVVLIVYHDSTSETNTNTYAYKDIPYYSGSMDGISAQYKGIYIFTGLNQNVTKVSFVYGTQTVVKIPAKYLPDNLLKEPTHTEYSGQDIQHFIKGVCVGDSITEGVINTEAVSTNTTGTGVVFVNGGTLSMKATKSYPAYLSKLTGISIYNAGISGITAPQMATTLSNSQQCAQGVGTWGESAWEWGGATNNALDVSKYDFAILHIGINDILSRGETAISEVLTQWDTAVTSIITYLKTNSPDIKIFLCTITPAYNSDDMTQLNEHIRNFTLPDDVYLIDINATSECEQGSPYANNHLTAIGYWKFAKELSSEISYYIHTHLSEFSITKASV